jgi:4-oxalocrotonate tautomerase
MLAVPLIAIGIISVIYAVRRRRLAGVRLYVREIGMPYVNVKLAGKLSKEQKGELAEGITALLEEIAKKPRQYTYVVFEEVERENWAVAGELLSE